MRPPKRHVARYPDKTSVALFALSTSLETSFFSPGWILPHGTGPQSQLGDARCIPWLPSLSCSRTPSRWSRSFHQTFCDLSLPNLSYTGPVAPLMAGRDDSRGRWISHEGASSLPFDRPTQLVPLGGISGVRISSRQGCLSSPDVVSGRN